jgi:hypothetical protein
LPNKSADANTREDAVMQGEYAEQRDVERDRARRDGAGGDFAERKRVREEEVGEGSGKQHRTGPRDSAGGCVRSIHGPLL